MSGKILNKALLLIITLFCACFTTIRAQEGNAYTPYSIFGIGDLVPQGTAYNKSMGGVGIAMRNRKVVNYLNPAAVTARDSLSFMTDFGLSQNNRMYAQDGHKSGHNTTNINDIVLSFPIYKSSAMLVGVAPYSGLGYDFLSYINDPSILGYTGTVAKMSSGSGSMYKIFTSAGVTFWKRLSLGVEYSYYFGHLKKLNNISFTNATYNGLSSGNEMILKAHGAKFGLQYERPVGNLTICAGATYKLSSNLKGTVDDFKISSGTIVSDTLKFNTDTLVNDPGRVKIANEIGVGFSVRSNDRWSAEIDYTYADWTNSGMDKVTGFSNTSTKSFSATAAQSVKAGFEITPNINDVRYYLRRCSYKAGLYYENAYYKLGGSQINSMGVTLGITFPISKLYNNGITFAVDMGQRGNISNGLIRERYVNFSICLNAFDIWFQKMSYK